VSRRAGNHPGYGALERSGSGAEMAPVNVCVQTYHAALLLSEMTFVDVAVRPALLGVDADVAPIVV